jgi:hypothetical protein
MSKYDEPVRTVADIREAEVFMLHSAVTLVHQKARLLIPGQTNAGDKEVIQLAAEWPIRQAPIPEHAFRHAFRQMEEGCLRRARQCGLVT